MAGKRSKSSKLSTRKKTTATAKKTKRTPATSPHHPYEKRIYKAVDHMLTDAQAIFNKLNPYDPNRSHTAGIITMIQDLMNEFDVGDPNQANHDSNIEQGLYATARIDDDYDIKGQTPGTGAAKPTPGNSHEERVAELLTTINTITREVLNLLDSTVDPGPQPDENDYGSTEDFIVAIADDTKNIVALIRHDIHALHTTGRYSIFSK
jgi:hypothetical protein